MRWALWWTLLALGVAAALYVEWHTDEVTVVLAALLLSAILLGAARPDHAMIGGAALGFSIPIAHLMTEASGMLRPRYLLAPIGRTDWIAMLVLGLVITGVGWGAGQIRARMPGISAPGRGSR
jgi:hypothetical protein